MPNKRKPHPKPPGPLLPMRWPSKGKPYHRVIASGKDEKTNREYWLHATKGYRSQRG